MELISFLHLMFGNLFVIRTMHVFRERAVIRESDVTKTGIACLALMNFSIFGLSHAPVRALIASTFLMISPLALFMILENRRLLFLRARLPLFLDRWILNLRLGNSLSSARDAALREECENFQALLRPVFDVRGKERVTHPLLPPLMLKELENLARTQSAPLARLESLRGAVRKMAEFRRKSGQATRQTRIQSIVMLILLFAMAVFTVHRYGWTRSGDFVLASALLSTIGVVLMNRLARKTQWKL